MCPRCYTALGPNDRICPFCRMPIPVARSPPTAPSPPIAPSPPRVCSSCRTELSLPQRVPVPQRARAPVEWEAYVCPRCGHIEWYEPRP